MNFLSIFDVIGPNMIGPSSSHTAGAVSIALMARKMFPEDIKKVTFTLYGSFAKTYHGHGTDRFLVGSLDSLQMTSESGMPFRLPKIEISPMNISSMRKLLPNIQIQQISILLA